MHLSRSRGRFSLRAVPLRVIAYASDGPAPSHHVNRDWPGISPKRMPHTTMVFRGCCCDCFVSVVIFVPSSWHELVYHMLWLVVVVMIVLGSGDGEVRRGREGRRWTAATETIAMTTTILKTTATRTQTSTKDHDRDHNQSSARHDHDRDYDHDDPRSRPRP